MPASKYLWRRRRRIRPQIYKRNLDLTQFYRINQWMDPTPWPTLRQFYIIQRSSVTVQLETLNTRRLATAIRFCMSNGGSQKNLGTLGPPHIGLGAWLETRPSPARTIPREIHTKIGSLGSSLSRSFKVIESDTAWFYLCSVNEFIKYWSIVPFPRY